VKEVTMNLGIMRRFATAGVLVAAAGSLAIGTAAGAAGASQSQRGASQPAHGASRSAHGASRSAHGASRSAHGASAPHRQIGTAQLTYFKVVLTATRGTGQPPTATVTAAGYERSGTGWRLLAVKRIGQPGQWFWYAVQTCSLDITQYQGVSPVRAFDSVKVSLLATPALGCTQLFSERWKP
jgi:hypothetical protein